MTRIAVHALAPGRLLVCGDDGRRWVLDAPAAGAADARVPPLADAQVQAALASLRARGPDADAPPPSDAPASWVASLHDLVDLAATVSSPVTVRWSFAGRVHRMLLRPGAAEGAAREVADLLRASVADAEEAVALAARPLLDEITGVEGESRGQGIPPAPGPGVLERWADGSWQPHPLDPPPLVDPVTGVLRRIVERPRDPEAPPGFVHLHAELPHLASVDGRFRPDPLAPAGGFRGSSSSPESEAVLSGIAHLSGAYLGQGVLRTATAAELRHENERVLTVSEWAPHDPRLHAMPGFPFVADHPALRMPWLRGEDEHGPCWAPLSLVHAGYLSSGLEELPRTNGHNLVGLQAGFSAREALDRAAAHLIAQDAVARWWDGGGSLPEVPLPDLARAGWGASPWRTRVLAVPTPFAIPVRLAVVDAVDDGIVAVGYAGAASSEDAAARALAEALVQHASARDLARPDSLIRDAASLGNGGVAGLAAHDPERRYGAVFDDRRSMVDPMCHVQYGLDPRVVDRTRRRLRPAGALAEHPRRPLLSPYDSLLAARERHVRVDVTAPRARAAGARAVRLLAPGLRRLDVAAFTLTADPYPGW